MQAAAMSVALFVALLPAAVLAQDTEPFAVFGRELLGKAQPDECYYDRASRGEPAYPHNGPQFLADGCPPKQDTSWLPRYSKAGEWVEQTVQDPAFPDDPTKLVPLMMPGAPKVNQAYIWGLARSGDDIWFGTMANTNCLVLGEYLGYTSPTEDPNYICEAGRSPYAFAPWDLPRAIGDWRPPRIFRYDVASGGAPADVTPVGGGGRLLTETTIGFRSAGVLGDVVLLAGPALPVLPGPIVAPFPSSYADPPAPPVPGLNVFAFDAATRAFIGWQTIPGYVNVRRWVAAGGALYTSVQNAAGGGSVLRWRGYTRPDPVGDPLRIACDFEVVGTVDLDAADLVEHNGRLYVATWPVMDIANPRLPGIWMSPPLPAGGLTAAHAGGWRMVWSAADYEPDPVAAYTYGGGAMASFNGHLYFSTMHVPFVAWRVFTELYPTITGAALDSEGSRLAAVNTWRAISVFRTKGFDTAWPVVELLYGESRLPAWNGDAPPTWRSAYNRMLKPPRYGASGFGNPYNNYLWSFAVHDGQLFAGTMDGSYVAAVNSVDGLPAVVPPHGADLYRFLPADLPAVPESLDGLGNWANYGVRNMLPAPEGLYVGSANPMNLSPDGGWELLRLTQRRGIFPPEGAPGTLFTVSGAGYGARKGKVFVGGKAAPVLFWSPKYLLCRLPARAPGGYTVKVVTAAGKAFKYPGAFTVPAPPPPAP